MELTQFQTDCERRLTSALQQVGKSISNRKIDGKHEAYIVGNIAGHDITFWIYEDAADFRTPKEHPIFESPDYGSLEELATTFTESLIKAIEE